MNGLHSSTKPMKGSPSLTLLLAPPSVGIVALDTFDGDPTKFNNAAAMVLGWILVLFMLFARIGPAFVREPGVLGEYWAYVFPLAAVATAWIRYASVVNTTAATIVAAAFMSVAIVALVSVLARMTIHCFQCFRGQAQWGDPLLGVPSQLSRPEPTATRPQRFQDNVI
ncbi:expressed unknown protein [Seminavis robusta]|uniref:Uncharacterized protein n=1 Tax=Seminavis robusta TaxID=568900 RepID=A0A9N8DVD9_9STRA|nr:expressed unknown protein [Seminavis robusta]|eukprot:Sro400_g135020.1 n/a (168) ;mRNA; r:13638-14141